MKINRFALVALLTFIGAASVFAVATFTPTGVIDMIPTSMSDDASIVVGTGVYRDSEPLLHGGRRCLGHRRRVFQRSAGNFG